MPPAVKVEGLGKKYRLGVDRSYGRLTESLSSIPRLLTRGRRDTPREFWAVRHISFDIQPGEILGVIGPNGAGKSTLLKLLSRITRPTEGRAELRGRVGSLLEVGTGFHPELTGRENIFLSGAILGMQHEEIRGRFDDIVDFSGIGSFLDTPVKRYSSGMQVRLGFAVAAHLDTEILLIDEVLAVGDVDFQRKCLESMQTVSSTGRTIVFVSHNLAAVQSLCKRGLLLESGRIATLGNTQHTVQAYLERVNRASESELASRTDRKGTGVLRVDGVVIRGSSPELAPALGDPMQIELDYRCQSDRANLVVSIGLYDSNGQIALGLGSDVTADSMVTTTPRGTVTCHIPRLPLVPGRYTLNIYVEVNGEIADWIQSAAKFDVEVGDFYGTGRPPHRGFGTVVTEHSWTATDE